MTPDDDLLEVSRLLKRELTATYASLSGVIATQQTRLDQIIAQLKADGRDEINQALAGQCQRLRLVLRELAMAVAERRPAPTNSEALVERSRRAVESLLSSRKASGPPESGNGDQGHPYG